ncbi:MAG: transglycosylase SLT domain-containing protein [Terracidiphilus sp.]
MRLSSPPSSHLRLAGYGLAVLFYVFAWMPLAGQTASEPAAPPASAETKSAAPAQQPAPAAAAETTPAKPSNAAGDKAAKPAAKTGKRAKRPVSTATRAARRARTARIKLAFQASSELRPMAQQLATMRTPAAYAGVTSYARNHTGDAAAAAYLALGHAYLLDKRYSEAVEALRQARKNGEELADYDDFLAARAHHEAGEDAAAEMLLRGFAQRYPESTFDVEAPELEAETLLALKDVAGAERVLAAAAGSAAASRSGFLLAQGDAASAGKQTQRAEGVYKRLLLTYPLTPEAEIARAKLTEMGAETSLTTAELRSLGDAYWNAGRYQEAGEQFRALLRRSNLDTGSRNSFAVAAAACDLKLKRLTVTEASALANTPDESGARRLYLLMELARNREDLAEQRRIVTEMESRFPQSTWLAEALFDTGNTFMLRREFATAVEYYSYLAAHFPASKNASAAHWKAGWLSYRQGQYADAARLFDEQIRRYPTAQETVSALYWRGRLYETQEHKPAQAAANYSAIIRAYQHFFYAQMARQRLAALGNAKPAPQPQLDAFQAPPVPPLKESFPADSPHLARARLLANAGLNDYIAQEIAADPDSASWSTLAEAEIYASYGENFRALRAVKRALPSAATASLPSIPLTYWHILFPKPYWDTIQAESAKNHLDPYLVASLIRQESEFNPSAVSPANAYGLMQMLPSVGKQMAREEGISHFQTFQLFDPATNIRLGTRYLRQTLNKFGGVNEYALAAYDAGDDRVLEWQAAGPYTGIDEFVESIPFAETRGYVESILRNMETYKAIDLYAAAHAKTQ